MSSKVPRGKPRGGTPVVVGDAGDAGVAVGAGDTERGGTAGNTLWPTGARLVRWIATDVWRAMPEARPARVAGESMSTA
jgi:hypothetical protein